MTAREPNNNIIIICKAVGQFQTFVQQMCLVTEKIWPFNLCIRAEMKDFFFLLKGHVSCYRVRPVLESLKSSLIPYIPVKFIDSLIRS